MDQRTKEKIARELMSGAARATKKSVHSLVDRLPKEEQEVLSKRKR